MTSSYHSKVRSTQNKGVTFLFGKWNFFFFPCLSETKVSTVNSDLTNLRWRSMFEWEHQMNYVFLTRVSYNLFTKTLLLFGISVLNRFIYRRVNVSKIFRGATIPIMLTKNQVKTISVHFLKKKLPSSQNIYLITIFILTLLHTVSRIDMYGLLYTLALQHAIMLVWKTWSSVN